MEALSQLGFLLSDDSSLSNQYSHLEGYQVQSNCYLSFCCLKHLGWAQAPKLTTGQENPSPCHVTWSNSLFLLKSRMFP